MTMVASSIGAADLERAEHRVHGYGTETVIPILAPNEGPLKRPEHAPARSPPIVSRFSVLEVSYLDERRIGIVVFDEHDSHAPARVGTQESTEL